MKYFYYKSRKKPSEKRYLDHYAITDDNMKVIKMWVDHNSDMDNIKEKRWNIFEGIRVRNDKIIKGSKELSKEEFEKRLFIELL